VLSTKVAVTCHKLGDEVHVVRALGHEAVNALSSWTIDFLTPAPVALEDCLGASLTLAIADGVFGTTRRIGLIVATIGCTEEGPDGYLHRLVAVPREWLLTQRSGYAAFQGKSARDIIQSVLEASGTPSADIVFRLSGSYASRPYCVQYSETEWRFVQRLCAEEGISCWFDAVGEKPVIVFGDAKTSHDGIDGNLVVPFEDRSQMTRIPSFLELERVDEVGFEAVHVRDYDVRHPSVYFEGKAGQGPLEYFEYPARVDQGEAAKARAPIRLQQLQKWTVHARGVCDDVRVQPGRILAVEGCSDAALNVRYLVVEATHYHARTLRAGEEVAFRSTVRMVPEDRLPFRPDVPHRRAPSLSPRSPRHGRPHDEDGARVVMVEGFEPAVTTGPAGEEIHVNDLGELKVAFPWDRSGTTDDKSSTWARCVQMGMGGAMLLPRVGWEVPVMYFDGNPDRPLVLGRAYNGRGVVPYGLPHAAATTTFQSATSPGGGSTNEIRMKDGAGGQEMFIHATKDQSVNVGGSQTHDVGADETHDVGLSLGISIDGTHKHSVGGDQKVDVSTDFALKVEGARSETVAALEHSKVTGNRTCSAKGGYTETVGALYGLECNQANTDVKAAYSQLIGASRAYAAGMGSNESVAGARASSVGGMRNIVSAKAAGDSVTGALSITAGGNSVKAGTAIVTKSLTSSGKISCSSANLSAGKPLVIKSPQITFDVSGDLTAGALSMTGGALKSTKGTVKVDGTIKRQGGSKIE
jgi:type VI secretion system secreted protein VgrG